MAADLFMDTAVRRLAGAPGGYAATLPDAWSYERPSGGVLMTVALRAMRAELADEALLPVSATALFCSPVPAGPMHIRVEVLRRGNVTAQVRAALSWDEAAEPAGGAERAGGPALSWDEAAAPGSTLGLEVSATFGRERAGVDLLDARPPDVPLPAEAPVLEQRGLRTDGRPWPFFDAFETRLALGDPFWERSWSGSPRVPRGAPGEARLARWMRYLTPQRLPGGALDPLALPPVADTMPPALIQALGPEAPRFYAPSLDLTVHFLDPTPAGWLLVCSHVRRARGGHASGEAEIWSEDGRLVAYATQMMMLRKAPR